VNVQATFAATLVDEWARAGVVDAVVSPGSRSTPLALALARDDRFRVHVVLDERSAGFFAVGLGLGAGVEAHRPAVVVTTSGTAAVELHPSVVEADLAGVPMVVCTADRPPELHHVGAPQTVEQRNLFADAVRWSAEPGVPDAAAASTWRSLASRAFAEATVRPGPVHLNLAFRDPLVGDPDELPPGRPDGAPWHQVDTVAFAASDSARLPDGARGVIVAGAGAGDPEVVHGLAEALGWPVLADPRSGCRVPRRTTVAAADAILRARTFDDVDFVLRLGAPWASKVVNQWLASLAVEQWLADPHGLWRDPERVVSRVVRALPDKPGTAAPGGWLDAWVDAESKAQAAIEATIAGEPAIARNLVRDLPDGATLVVSSSMPIRDVEWFAAPRDGVRIVANRGANGIDGVMSTALGVAAATGAPTYALLGDLAFLHDVGALALAVRRPDLDCTFVVVDNGGGGIFSFLPQATALSGATFEQLFGTPHGLNLEAIAQGFGAPKVQVLRSDRSHNVSVHSDIQSAVTAALGVTA
jgi:2-succinyl-5-enolpyruvyl-6-hydroxy-3-cyclohexene-1-carboxylate synthase